MRRLAGVTLGVAFIAWAVSIAIFQTGSPAAALATSELSVFSLTYLAVRRTEGTRRRVTSWLIVSLVAASLVALSLPVWRPHSSGAARHGHFLLEPSHVH